MSREGWKSAALVLAAHGASQGTAAQDIVEAQAARLRARGLFSRVLAGFRYGAPGLGEIPGLIGPGPAYVVPFTAGDGPFARDFVPHALAPGNGAGSGEPRGDRVRFRFCRPLGTHHGLADVAASLAQEALTAARLADSGAELVLAGHGTTRDPSAAETLLNIVASLNSTASFATVHGAFLEQDPRLAAWRGMVSNDCVVVVPFLMGGGGHEADIHELLGLAPGKEDGQVEGRRVLLTAPIGSHPALTDLILDLVEDGGQ